MTLRELVEGGVERLPSGVAAAARPHAARLAEYLGLVEDWNRRINLVSRRTTRGELVERHLLDSLEALPLLPGAIEGRRLRLLDVGSGAGFPAMPLLVCRGDLDGILYEATAKKCAFLGEVVARLRLTARVVNARFPAAYPMDFSGGIHVITSRAVAGIWPEIRSARKLVGEGARTLLWTTRDLQPGFPPGDLCKTTFHASRFAERRGIAVLECFT